jgi:hypothetical protein
MVIDDRALESLRHSMLTEDHEPGISEESETNGNGTRSPVHWKPRPEPATPKVEEKRKPTQFQEPDANSLLDAFGF